MASSSCTYPGMRFGHAARRLGIAAAAAIVLLELAYAATLAVGFARLPSHDQPIGEPMVSLLEAIIVLLAPAMVAMMVALHAWAPASRRPFSLCALVFTAMLATITAGVHFTLLAVGRHPTLAAEPWLPLLLSFRWPSVAYALDILAWDLLFPLAVWFAAAVVPAGWLRALLVASGALAFAGLAGVFIGDMQVRNIGIVGYVPLFAAAALLMARLFQAQRRRNGGHAALTAARATRSARRRLPAPRR